MEKGLLNPDSIVGQPNDYTSQLSYPVIKKLRRVRIFPLGLEVAAYKIFNGEAEPATLKEIVKGFDQGSLLSNGDLEQYGDEEVPDGWEFNGGIEPDTYHFSRESNSGSFSYFIQTNSAEEGEWHGIRSNKIYIQPDTTYSVSAQARLMYASGDGFGLRVLCNKDDGTGTNFQCENGGCIIGKTRLDGSNPVTWQRLYGTFTTNSEADYCEIILSFGNGESGGAYLDSVKMTQGEKIPEDYKFEKSSQFYHLVNPNWLLKAPSYKCGAMAYSAVPLPETNQRQKSCTDIKDCIRENDNGECLAYSYCTREKNTWNFSGQSCPSQFSSCDTYTRKSDGQTFSYLTKTLDFDGCDSSNAGCTWYCNDWSGKQGTWKCSAPGKSLDYDSGETVDSPTNTLFLTSNVKECSSTALNCNEYIDMSKGNLIYNGGFEIVESKRITGWGIDLESGKEVSESSYRGEYAMTERGDWNYASQETFTVGGANYTLNFQSKTNNNKELAVNLKFYNENGDILIPQSNSQIDTPDFDSWSIGCGDNSCHIITKNNLTDRYRSFQFSFNTPQNARRVRVSLGTGSEGSGNIFVDQVSLFQGLEQKNFESYADPNSKFYLQEANKCQAEDIGCKIYTEENTDVEIPAVINENDSCPSQCVGYNSFLEMPTSFDLESTWKNFIPSTGEKCNAPGCEGFTNLGAIEKGGESTEYYSYLRKCLILPENSADCSNFYTWVGSDTAGYQLKRYQLQKSETGGPARNSSYENAKDKWGECESELDLMSNPHCKQFYDSNGNKYFRLYENTVSCSKDCVRYRRDKNGEEFMGLPEKSNKCLESEVGCKEYKGVDASKAQRIMFKDFEDGTTSPWEAGEDSIISISNEAFSFPGHSLEIASAGLGTDRRMVFYDVSDLVELQESYELNFWVKGVSSLTAGFSSLQEKNVTDLSPGEWQQIELGPFVFDGDISSNEKLRIEAQSTVFYIDNVSLKSSTSINLIENSWRTPDSCGLDTIGCSAYTDSNGDRYYLNSFNHLCESSEVGCSAFIDTKNYKSPYSKKFNTSEDTFVRVEADEQVYLVDNKDSRCQAADKGCQRLGKPDLNADGSVSGWNDVYLENNPDQYETNSIICQDQELGCQAYGEGYYFKDPTQTGKVCEYKEDVLVYGQGAVGWFKKGTNEPCYIKDDGTGYKSNDIAYGILSANESVNGVDYKGFVGVCPRNQDNCTQFQTEYENQSNEEIKTRSYYYIDNQRLSRSSCNGTVSRADGCILFKNPNKTNLNREVINRYNSFATYNKYEELGRPVSPVNCENIRDCSEEENKNSDYCKYCAPLRVEKRKNNMNDIIKVIRDRICGEWLSCISSHLVWDKSSNSYVEECDYIGRCDELIGKGDDSQCGNIVESSGAPLNESRYKYRDVSWNGMDYSGFSIFNAYPVETLSPYVNQSKNTEYLTHDEKTIGVEEQNRKPQLSCQIYPEKDSPYKKGVKEFYPDVNVCSQKGGDGYYQDCQCAYTKAKFGQIAKYYNPNSEIPNGVCSRVGQGHEIGEECDPPSTAEMKFSDFVSPCGEGGMCQSLTDKSSAVGQRGFCLETDPSKPEDINTCISWWPGQSLSDPETNTQSISASYKPSKNRLWYCSEYNVGIEKLEGKTSLESCDNGSCQDQFDVRSNSNECFKDYLDGNETKAVYKLDSKYKWERDDIENITVDYKFNNSYNVGSCSNLKSVCQPGHGAHVQMDENTLVSGDQDRFVLSDENSWSIEGECSWVEEITQEIESEVNNQNDQDFKVALENAQTYIRDRVRIKADFKNGLLDGFTVSLDAGKNASIIKDLSSSGLTFKINDATINFGQCEKVVKVPTDEQGLATVFTNRINNIKDYSQSAFDDKDYNTKCQPWGALHYSSDWNPSNTELVLSSDNTCYKDQDKGTVWGDTGSSGKDELKNIIPKINTCWEKGSKNNYSDQCSNYKWNFLSSLPTIRKEYGDYDLPHIEDKNQSNKPFSINGKVKGELESEKAYSAKMEFYAWVDKNAMPMRNIEIDWGGDQINDNSFVQSYNVISKNYKPSCCESKEDCNNMDEAKNDLDPGLNFGNIPSSCKEDFLRFERTYFCEGSGSVGWEKYGCENACCFKPKVKIKDNWGFYNRNNQEFDGVIKVVVPQEEE